MSFTIDYKDKVVLVTGVSSGIGLGTLSSLQRPEPMLPGVPGKRQAIHVRLPSGKP